ncbi:hypothetical protein CPC08DRAFT_746953 [Agrocybe pediades]|nr:hypothetical protein CPC08DRAFT_746953 [Agrocybe pediades]
MFSKAKNTVITGGLFQMQQVHEAKDDETQQAFMDVLQPKVALGAFHDSAERRDPPRCHPGTRTHVLKAIMDWVRNAEKVCMFMWLYGPAGAGKTAIAQTIAEQCRSSNLLAATFFFSHMTADRNNERSLVATIVYQLIISIPEIRSAVLESLQKDPLLLTRALDTQLHDLLISPLNKAAKENAPEFNSRPRLVILDGLDECSDARTQLNVLKALAHAAEQLHKPLFFFIATRPEFYLRKTLSKAMGTKTSRISLDDEQHPRADIEVFLRSKFADIVDDHPAGPYLPDHWPSEEEISHIVTKSSGQFIYASTVMRFIEAYDHMPPERLRIIFSAAPVAGNESPFAELDALYLRIFSAVPTHNVENVLDIMSILLLTPGVEMTPSQLSDFLAYNPGEVYAILTALHSLIAIPSADDGPGRHLYTFHASLSDFLLDRSRSGLFYIDKPRAYAKLTKLSLKQFTSPNGTKEALKTARMIFKESIFHALIDTTLFCDLISMDIITHLSWLCSGGREEQVSVDRTYWQSGTVFAWEKIPTRTLFRPLDPDVQKFVAWLQRTSSPATPDDYLLHHHRDAFDRWLLSELEEYLARLGRDELIAMLEVENISAYFNELYAALVNIVVLYEWSPGWHGRSIPIKLKSLPNPTLEVEQYLEILRSFFASEQRSGKHCFHPDKNLRLVSSIVLFLCLGRHEEEDNFEDVALECLPGILLRASGSPRFPSRMSEFSSSAMFARLRLSRQLKEISFKNAYTPLHGKLQYSPGYT